MEASAATPKRSTRKRGGDVSEPSTSSDASVIGVQLETPLSLETDNQVESYKIKDEDEDEDEGEGEDEEDEEDADEDEDETMINTNIQNLLDKLDDEQSEEGEEGEE
eukprot:154737-Prymnesium_polylepis.1